VGGNFRLKRESLDRIDEAYVGIARGKEFGERTLVNLGPMRERESVRS
jgi:hypothetical protein